jgi:hypothetical protein
VFGVGDEVADAVRVGLDFVQLFCGGLSESGYSSLSVTMANPSILI